MCRRAPTGSDGGVQKTPGDYSFARFGIDVLHVFPKTLAASCVALISVMFFVQHLDVLVLSGVACAFVSSVRVSETLFDVSVWTRDGAKHFRDEQVMFKGDRDTSLVHVLALICVPLVFFWCVRVSETWFGVRRRWNSVFHVIFLVVSCVR